MSKKLEIMDDNGNLLPVPEAHSDVMALLYLLEYARARDFQLGPTIQVGETIVQVRDLRQAAKNAPAGPAPDKGIWAQNGHDEGDK